MTLSDLIDQLDQLREWHGDVPVYVHKYRSVDLANGADYEPGLYHRDSDSVVPTGSVVIS
jgi:hypothetical protein